MNRRRLTFRLLFLISFSFIVYFSYQTCISFLEQERARLLLEKRKTAFWLLAERIKKEIAHFPGEAGIVIKDLEKGWEIQVNKDKVFAAASLLKLPIMAVCFYAADEGKIDLEENFRLKSRHKVSGSGLLKYKPAGIKLSLEQLCALMITESDNTACNMLINRLGFNYLNNTFKKLGLNDTSIRRKMMDFRSRRKGWENLTSAKDLKLLLNKIYNGTLINQDVSFKCLQLLKQQKTKDRIPAKLPQNIVVAHKTGLEKNVCHDAGIVFTPGGNFLICALTKHKNKNSKSAKTFIAQIAFLTYSYYQTF